MNKLEQVLVEIWSGLNSGVGDRRHGFHHPVIATMGANQMPKSRVVVLRAADSENQTLRFHSDVRSEKWNELGQHALISLNFYDEASRIQIRAEGKAVLHRKDDLAGAAWEHSQRMSQACYATMPVPGSKLDNPDHFALPHSDEEIAMGYENFGAVVIHVHSFEWLFLRAGGHRRARFDLLTNQAQWMVP